ncbi:MAG: hypothetical protein EOP06_29950, partial [Proteobacteria bacterium]
MKKILVLINPKARSGEQAYAEVIADLEKTDYGIIKLSEEERNELRPVIEKEALSFAVAFVDNDEIDRINILQASFKAMHLAVEKLSRKPNLLLVESDPRKRGKNSHQWY